MRTGVPTWAAGAVVVQAHDSATSHCAWQCAWKLQRQWAARSKTNGPAVHTAVGAPVWCCGHNDCASVRRHRDPRQAWSTHPSTAGSSSRSSPQRLPARTPPGQAAAAIAAESALRTGDPDEKRRAVAWRMAAARACPHRTRRSASGSACPEHTQRVSTASDINKHQQSAQQTSSPQAGEIGPVGAARLGLRGLDEQEQGARPQEKHLRSTTSDFLAPGAEAACGLPPAGRRGHMPAGAHRRECCGLPLPLLCWPHTAAADRAVHRDERAGGL